MKTLFAFQRNALNYLKSKNKVLLALDMGLGKTFTGLNWVKEKNDDLPVLILCQKNKMDDWEEETKNVLTNCKVFKVKSQKHFLALLKENEHTNVVYILSYSMFSLFTKRHPKWWMIYFKRFCTLIFDESQGLRNRTSLISKYTYKLSIWSKYVLLLSGDPTPNGYKDLFAQMKVLNIFIGGYNWYDFLTEFCVTQPIPGFSVLNVVGYKNIDHLTAMLKPYSYFLKTKDAIDLPDTWWVTETGEVSPLYQKFRTNKIIEVNGAEIVSNGTLSELTILRQLSSGFVHNIENNEYHEVSSFKIDLLRSLLENNTKENIVVFYNFTYERKMITHLLSELQIPHIVRIDGEQNDSLDKIIPDAQNIILVQYQTGARGIDGLQKHSHRMIYYSPPLSGELFKQSIKRIHRIGQENKCIYHTFVNSKLESLIYKTLKTYQDFTNEIFAKLKEDGEL